jgi:hypothetical protein
MEHGGGQWGRGSGKSGRGGRGAHGGEVGCCRGSPPYFCSKHISLVLQGARSCCRQVLAPAVLARMIPANLRSEISLIPAKATAGLIDTTSRPMPKRLVHRTKYAHTADLSHVTYGNRIRSDSPFASAIGYGRGIMVTFRMSHDMQLICVDRPYQLGKPAVS